MMLRLDVELAPGHKIGLNLRNPVMIAAGVWGYGTEYGSLVDAGRLGAVVTNGVTLRPRRGARQPRMVETVGGFVHAGGRQNPGIGAVLREKAAVWAALPVPVILNVAGETPEDLRRVAALASAHPSIAALELDLSSPDLPMSAELAGEPRAAALAVEGVRMETDLPLLAKIAAGPRVVEMARALAAAGIDALTVSNSLPALGYAGQGPDGPLWGGLSGAAIKPLALLAVQEVSEVVEVPVVGCGGIGTAGDALEFLAAGASAVQVGSAIFLDPLAPIRVLEGVEAFLDAGGYGSVGEFRQAGR